MSVTLAHWWNGLWGTATRRDIWLERLDSGQFQVRWRGGRWRDRDGRHITSEPRVAVGAVRALMADTSDTVTWRQIDANGLSG